MDIDFKNGPYNDIYNARIFADVHKGKLIWAKNYGGWYIWNGKYWEADNNDKVKAFAVEIADLVCKREASSTADKEWARHKKNTGDNRSLNAMIDCAKAFMGATVEFDRDRLLLNCENGVVDLRKGELLGHNPSFYITKTCRASYNPQANAQMWNQFLMDIFLEDEVIIDYIQKVMGYCLTGLTGEQCFFILWGDGLNGKGTFIETINYVLKDYATTCDSDSLMTRKMVSIPNDIARLKGARFVSTTETQSGTPIDEERIKKLTGQDKILARFLRQEHFEFYPEFKIFITTNHKPTIKGTDAGIWRRVKMIPFLLDLQSHPEKVDRMLRDKLFAEVDGILYWMVLGCKKYFDEGLKMPTKIDEATKKYMKEEDKVGSFIVDECITQEEYVNGGGKGQLCCPVASFRERINTYFGYKYPIKPLKEYMKRKGFCGEDDNRVVVNDKQIRAYLNVSLRDNLTLRTEAPLVDPSVEVGDAQQNLGWEQ